VFTNSVRIAGVLAERPGIEVFLLGGRVRGVTQAIVGAEAHAMLAKLRVDVAFMGTNGISVEHGFSTPDPAEAAMKEAMVRAARHVYVLADSTKFGSDEAVRFAELSDVDGLVTDERLAPGARAALEAAGLEVTLA
jgi:DeoR family fructose operon transcriptional repressor